mmetsp:Transcript_11654/g.26699  ORF Transcript_11654/g.26699 Transcript_11654/m.26699 type:complete len:405 (-) Transcript_11654:125-1339(-)
MANNQGIANLKSRTVLVPDSEGRLNADSDTVTMFITQRAQVSGQKVQTLVKLPRIDSAKGAEPATNSAQSSSLIQANKEMADVQTKLDAKKAEFNIRMSKCKEKEELLAMKQSKLKLESENYKLFLQEFNAKRERAEKRAKEEIQIRKAKEEEIEILKEELKNLRKRLDEAKKKLEGGLMYQNYLESVVDFGEDFGEIEDITKKRYPMLVFTSQELKEAVAANMAEAEAAQERLAQLSKEMQNKVLTQSSAVGELQKRLEDSKLETVMCESNLENKTDDTSNNIRTLGEVRLAVFNLYNRCRNTHMSDSRPKLDTKDVDVALRYIEERMRELALIVKDGKDRGVIGDVKVREADVNAVTKSSTERKEGTSPMRKMSRSAKNTPNTKGEEGKTLLGSFRTQPPIH